MRARPGVALALAVGASGAAGWLYLHRGDMRGTNAVLAVNSPRPPEGLVIQCRSHASASVGAYAKFLEALDPAKPESILAALERFRKDCRSDRFSEFNDGAFLRFRAFHAASLEAVMQQYHSVFNLGESATDPIPRFIIEENPWLAHLDQYGFQVRTSEGDNYLREAPDFLRERFADWVSPELSEFIRLRSREIAEGFSEDAGLMISFDRVAERALAWESLLKRYPHHPLRDEAQGLFDTYLSTLLSGMDNSRLYDLDSNVLRPELKALYERIMKEHPDTHVGEAVGKLYRLLEKVDFDGSRVPEGELDRFFESVGAHSLLGVQPPMD